MLRAALRSGALRRHLSTHTAQRTDGLVISEQVQAALAANAPVVALETTIVTHGMPFPHNLRVAREVEEIVRQNGAVPATIGVVGGRVRVGLSTAELERLAASKSALKCSTRDLPFAVSQGIDGGTTVAATVAIAQRAGISVFVTGGLGGVHRGATETMDISADLVELGRNPVAVVCAGVKSILDIGRTLEFLETQGVTVATLGGTRDFPAFYVPTSGFMSPYHVRNEVEAARLIHANRSLGLRNGMVFAVPIPAADALLDIEAVIQRALAESRATGKAVTPDVLARLNELTHGATLRANTALIRNNAAVGARIARSLSSLGQTAPTQSSLPPAPAVSGGAAHEAPRASVTSARPQAAERRSSPAPPRPVVFGGSVFDVTAQLAVPLVLGTSNPGVVKFSTGGVGRNVAEAMHRTGLSPLLVTAVGGDMAGVLLRDSLARIGLDTVGIVTASGHSTAAYNALHTDDGQMHAAVADMQVHEQVTPDVVHSFAHEIRHSPMVVVDGNLSVPTLSLIGEMCNRWQVPLMFEPTSLFKCRKMFEARLRPTFIKPNEDELKMMAAHNAEISALLAAYRDELAAQQADPTLISAVSMLSVVPVVIVSQGSAGLTLVYRVNNDVRVKHVPAKRLTGPIRSVTGAGDTLTGVMMASIVRGDSLEKAAVVGIEAAALSLQSDLAVPAELTPELFNRWRGEARV